MDYETQQDFFSSNTHFERVGFKYFGTTITDNNDVTEEIKDIFIDLQFTLEINILYFCIELAPAVNSLKT